MKINVLHFALCHLRKAAGRCEQVLRNNTNGLVVFSGRKQTTVIDFSFDDRLLTDF